MAEALPVHGFVLAGGRSSRMGTDKASLKFCGWPLVEIVVEKLRKFCANVSIAGNREDLWALAPVVRETRIDAGPAAGVEAGLAAAKQPWALFVPVDVPLVPADLLRRWAREGLRKGNEGFSGFYLSTGRDQPAFCMLHRDCLPGFSAGVEAGEHRLSRLLQQATGGREQRIEVNHLYEEEERPPAETIDRWFLNVNTPEDMRSAEEFAIKDWSSNL
jgi:molybdopterin-guanine dinucleotide biosynthesis protein A